MKRVLFAVAAVAIVGLASGTASAQYPGYPVSPAPITPAYSPTVVTPAVTVTEVVAPPVVVYQPAVPIIRVGYPWYYGRPYYGHYYYPHYYRR
jgi:uncharacterized lipoprotein YmbA